MNGIKIVRGGVTAARGFKAAGVKSGLKKSGKLDLALLFSDRPCVSAGTFTLNRVRSGSVILSEERIKKGNSQAIIVNSGNANCSSGDKEIQNADRITGLAAKRLGLEKGKVLMASTGIIGRPLPTGKILKGVGSLVKGLKANNGSRFAEAIMTTDTAHKETAVTLNIGNKKVTVGGAVKGSGMICPHMATMLAFFTTDAAIERSALKDAFKDAVQCSFNKITVDGDMSTNDSAFILANGAAANKPIKRSGKGYSKFLRALKYTALELAKKIVLDGEGATKFVEVSVKGARHRKDAEIIARHIAGSSLVKTMIAGGDPNWGRVAASVGSSGVRINAKKTDIYFGKALVMKNGSAGVVPRKPLLAAFRKKKIFITIDLKSGAGSARIWTCDLTRRYVEINAEYET